MMYKAWSSVKRCPIVFKVIRQISRSHGSEIVEFDPNWAFPNCNTSLNSPMATKWCTKLEVAWRRCPIVCQGHPSNCKVIRLENVDFDPNQAFLDCNSSLNSPIRNDAQSLKKHRRGAAKLQGHTGWKIEDLNPIWVRLLGRSQLSNPSDLPCYNKKRVCIRNWYTVISTHHGCSSGGV